MGKFIDIFFAIFKRGKETEYYEPNLHFYQSYFRDVVQKFMLTGHHFVRDVYCKKCQCRLGWMYEFASEDTQRYKEARTILEKALLTESNGVEDEDFMDYK